MDISEVQLPISQLKVQRTLMIKLLHLTIPVDNSISLGGRPELRPTRGRVECSYDTGETVGVS